MSGRRSHAERTAETRARIVAAVVESINELGFQRTTAAEITRRAGVTWGAVQHHFGSKDGILAAVLEDSFAHFAERIADAPGDDAPLEKRVAVFVDRAWEHFGSDRFRSAFEILLDQSRDGARAERPWQEGMAAAWERVWSRLFGDVPLPRRRARALQRYAIASLAGLGSLATLEGSERRTPGAQLDLLKATLHAELARAGERA